MIEEDHNIQSLTIKQKAELHFTLASKKIMQNLKVFTKDWEYPRHYVMDKLHKIKGDRKNNNDHWLHSQGLRVLEKVLIQYLQ